MIERYSDLLPYIEVINDDHQVCDMLSYAFRVVMSLIQKRDYR